ncbi:MAG: DNA polymerase [Desulfobacteraceae bacterium]|jgi:hypothetical protein
MLDIDFNDLYIKRQSRRQPKTRDIKHLSYDTETVKGRCRLLVNSLGEYVFVESFLDIIHFMCRDKLRSHIGFFWNLKYDFQAILKWLPVEDWISIHEKGRTLVLLYDERRGDINLEVTYIPQKFLKLKIKATQKGKTTLSWRFYDIAQYYGRSKLDTAANKYLGQRKIKLPTRFDIKNVTDDYCKDPEFVNYALKDAALTDQLSSLFIKTCQRMKLKGDNFSSPASLSYDYFSSSVKIPTINKFLRSDRLYELLRYPWNCISGAFISVFKKGRFNNAYVYDINSSYPARIANMPDLDQGCFFTDDGIPDDSYHWGWLHVAMVINQDDKGYYHPCLPIKRPNASNYYPIGSIDTWITLSEYRYFKQFHEIKIIDGLYWEPYIMRYPFKREVNRIYKHRLKTKDPLIKLFLKIVLNGLYGKFLQKIQERDPDSDNYKMWKAGQLFNPFYASYILADSRIAVHQLLMQIPNDQIIACFTDSVICTHELSIPLTDKLGGWGLDQQGEALVIGCGIYSLRDNNGKVKTKLRGFKNSKIDLFKVVEQQRDETELLIQSLLNVSPITSLIQKRPCDMNLLEDRLKTININFDTKRCWFDSWKRAGDIIDKKPIDSLPLTHLQGGQSQCRKKRNGKPPSIP